MFIVHSITLGRRTKPIGACFAGNRKHIAALLQSEGLVDIGDFAARRAPLVFPNAPVVAGKIPRASQSCGKSELVTNCIATAKNFQIAGCLSNQRFLCG